MDQFINRVFVGNSLHLLRRMPTGAVDLIPTDPMYGVSKNPNPRSWYDWGPDPCRGDPERWWDYHREIYHECLRVLRPGGKLAWAMGSKFRGYFGQWFGGYRIWSFSRHALSGRALNVFGHIWIVQTREQEPVRFPDADSFIEMRTSPKLLKVHPCPKAIPEMAFLVEHLSNPGDIVLDPFAGIGTSLLAAKQLGRRFIGCDLSRNYCRVALRRLRQEVIR